MPLYDVTSPAVPEQINGLPVLWRPEPGFQTRFCSRGAFEVLGGGAAGPGKTSCLIALAAAAAQHPKARVLFLRTVYKDLLDVRDRMQALYPQIGATWSGSDSRWIFPSGAPLMLAHGATMAEIGPFLGPEYSAIFWDELSLVESESVWQMLLSRIRSTDPTVRLQARASANPIGPGRDWLNDRFIIPCGEDGSRTFKDETTGRSRAYVPGTSKDNRFLPASYWDGLSDLPESIRVALQEGKWNSPLGMFYPELADNPDRLFVSRAQLPALLDWHEYWGAFDWGYTHPAVFSQFARVGTTIYCLDTLYMHKYQDEEQAAAIKGSSDRRCLRTVYAGHDAFAVRRAHSAATETVADVFGRYSIGLERAALDREAGSKVLRRLFASPKPGPQPKDTLSFRWVDTPGNRRAFKELAALSPDPTHPNAPLKRDANEKGLGGDDGPDVTRYGLATPSFEPQEPPPVWKQGNVETGVDTEFEQLTQQPFAITSDGAIDRRAYGFRSPEANADFPNEDLVDVF